MPDAPGVFVNAAEGEMGFQFGDVFWNLSQPQIGNSKNDLSIRFMIIQVITKSITKIITNFVELELIGISYGGEDGHHMLVHSYVTMI